LIDPVAGAPMTLLAPLTPNLHVRRLARARLGRAVNVTGASRRSVGVGWPGQMARDALVRRRQRTSRRFLMGGGCPGRRVAEIQVWYRRDRSDVARRPDAIELRNTTCPAHAAPGGFDGRWPDEQRAARPRVIRTRRHPRRTARSVRGETASGFQAHPCVSAA
jgi:hypothetical protein